MTNFWKQQAGSVLIVSLVILLVLTLLGLSGMSNTVMQERMAGNMQESMSAFQAAEAGLRAGEQDAQTNIRPDNSIFKADCTGAVSGSALTGLCEPAGVSGLSYDVWITSTSSAVYWDPTSAANDRRTRPYTTVGISTLQNVSRQPAYIIERLQVVERGGSLVAGFGSQPETEWYRITSRGFSRNGQSQATVQSVIRK
jgi:type IV pilus assembly protein PilX